MSEQDENKIFVTHAELKYIMESYEHNMKEYVTVSLYELKTEFIELFNRVISNNKEDMQCVSSGLNDLQKEISDFKTVIIVALLGFIFTQILDKFF